MEKVTLLLRLYSIVALLFLTGIVVRKEFSDKESMILFMFLMPILTYVLIK